MDHCSGFLPTRAYIDASGSGGLMVGSSSGVSRIEARATCRVRMG